MSNSIATSQSQKKEMADLLSRELPSYRQAYSDRTAWIMACMSELAYIRFNPLLRGISLDYFHKKISDLAAMDTSKINPRYIKKLEGILDIANYDHEKEKENLEQELQLLNYQLVQIFNKDETQAILVMNDQYAVLAFRGTEAISIKDIKANTSAVIKKDDGGGKIHSAFEEAFQKVRLDIEAALETESVKEKSLFITGHGLGGALATIAAKKITHQAGNAACYTFGAPRVGDENWISDIKTPVYRIVNAADCVTMLPPNGSIIKLMGLAAKFIPTIGKSVENWILLNFSGYFHGGNMRYLTNCPRGDYKEVRLLYSVSWFYRVQAWFSKNGPWKKFLSDHSISIYRKKLFIIARKRNHI